MVQGEGNKNVGLLPCCLSTSYNWFLNNLTIDRSSLCKKVLVKVIQGQAQGTYRIIYVGLPEAVYLTVDFRIIDGKAGTNTSLQLT